MTRELGTIEEIERVDMFFVKIVRRHKQVRDQIPSGGELPPQPDVRLWSVGPSSAARARRQLQHSSV